MANFNPGLRPFTRATLTQEGLTDWEQQKLLSSGEVVRLRRGVYVTRRADDARLAYLQRVTAELITRRDHYAVGASALAVHDLPNPYFRPWSSEPVHLAGPRSRPAAKIRAGTAVPESSAFGAVTDLATTASTIAAGLPLPQALMVTDAVARRLAGTADRHVLASARCRLQVRDTLTARGDLPALQRADPAAESPAESFYRGHMLLAGMPEPRCGVPLRGRSGAQYFADLLLANLIIEIDGRGKYTHESGATTGGGTRADAQHLIDEKRREDDLRAAGNEFHRAFVEDFYADPAAELCRLTQKMHDLGLHELLPGTARVPLPA